jgi:hypothetical protein
MPVRTLLVTDIVDSTRRVSELGDARAAELFARHDRLARDLLAAHSGREIDRSDAFLLLFDEAPAALAFARAWHLACAELGFSTRVGMHIADVVLRTNPASDVARGAKPLEVEGISGVEATSHGHWQMKGLAEPLELFEAGAALPPDDGAKAWRVAKTPQGWRPARAMPGRLPAERDAFVGREVDVTAISRLVDDGARLVNLTGIGGTGKTRLAVRYAWASLGAWAGGAWFCDATTARAVPGICNAVGMAMDVPLTDADPVVQLGNAIRGRGRCLVVVDNFEQVAEYAAETLGAWLDRATEAVFVVTSRDVLGVPGEHVVALPPLADAAAIELFVHRGRSAKTGWTPSSDDRRHVAELVRMLDGLPRAGPRHPPRRR